jgi:aminopeptidase
MIHDFAPKLAKIMTEYCCPVEKGDYVLIMAGSASEPLIEALVEAILKRGGNPTYDIGLPNLSEIYMKYATEEQFDFIDPATWTQVNEVDVLYSIYAPTNTKRLATFPGELLARQQQGQRKISEAYLKRVTDKTIRWNISPWPTQAAAQGAEMGLLAYTEFVYQACGLDQPDPVAYWTAFRDRQTRLVDWLKGKRHAEVRGPGVDLSFDFADREWESCHGTVNFPDGEIFTSPVEASVNGHVHFNYPSDYGGREINGVQLTFKDGKVIDACASKSEDYLLGQLDMDDGARYLGEFAIGTNNGIQKFTHSILFDEKIGGSIHMALGHSVRPEGQNKSAIHWDMVHNMKDGGEILIDGELFYKSGDFVME